MNSLVNADSHRLLETGAEMGKKIGAQREPPGAAIASVLSPPGPAFSVDGHRIGARHLAPALYIVATPIGNLGDITLRALATLAAADLVACEDTRVTGVLLRHFGIATRPVAYHDHYAARQRPKLLAALGEGKAVAGAVHDRGGEIVHNYRHDLPAFAHPTIATVSPSRIIRPRAASASSASSAA